MGIYVYKERNLQRNSGTLQVRGKLLWGAGGEGGGENTHASSERKERKPCILGLQVQERGMIPQNHNNNREIKQNNKNEKKKCSCPNQRLEFGIFAHAEITVMLRVSFLKRV